MKPSELGPQIERYLLGQSPPRERDHIETLLFGDDAVWPLVEDAEDDLIDRYLTGELSAADREAFERHFAASPTRQERIAFRRAFPRALPGRSGPERGGESKAPPRSRPAMVAGPAWVGLAALLVLAVWLGGRSTFGPRSPFGEPSPGRPESPRGTVSPSSSEPSLPDRPALVLRPGLLRGGGAIPRLEVPSGPHVRIDLEPGFPSSAPEFSVVLRTVEGREVWKGSGRPRPDGPLVSVVIPRDVLRPGDYTLSLSPATSPSSASEYPLRVSGRTAP